MQTTEEKLHPPLDKRPSTETAKQNNQEEFEPLHISYKRKYGQKYSQMVYSSAIAASKDFLRDTSEQRLIFLPDFDAAYVAFHI